MGEGAISDVGLLLLRLGGACLAFAHGRLKVVGLAAGGGEGVVRMIAAAGFPMPRLFAWAAGLSELVGGSFVALGLLTPLAAAAAAFTMTVAVFGHHRALRHLAGMFGARRGAQEKVEDPCGLESALVYLLLFLAVALLGPGRFSLDHVLGLAPWL